jgi:hypothetical protein
MTKLLKVLLEKEGTVMQQNDRYLVENLKRYPTHRCRLYESAHITTAIYLLQQLLSKLPFFVGAEPEKSHCK